MSDNRRVYRTIKQAIMQLYWGGSKKWTRLMSRRLLKLGRAEIAQGGMQTLRLYQTSMYSKIVGLRFGFGRKGLIGTLSFQGGEEALHGGIIITIARAAHAHPALGQFQ